MSQFSELLSQYMERKDVQTYRLAQYCGYDRANMYKIIKGKRNPPGINFVEKVAEYMHLLPSEKESLYEAYQISVVGQDNYYRRKSVMEFMTEVSRGKSLTFAMSSVDVKANFQMIEKKLVPLEGSHDVRSGLLYVIAEETCLNNGSIRLLLQPETDFLVSILAMCSNVKNCTRIDHIFCLDDGKKETGRENNYNLACLKNILPLYHYHYEYHAWYYYGHIPGQNEMFALFPYMVLTSRYACVLTADRKRGYLTEDTEMIKMLSLIFENCLGHASCFARLADEAKEQMALLKATFSNQVLGYCFQMTPCFMPVLTLEILEKYVKRDLPDRTVFLKQLWDYIGELAEQNLIYICSIDGIIRFLENGEISEIPLELYDIPKLDDRREMVQRLFRSEWSQRLRILKKSIGSIDTQIYLYVTPERGTLRLPVSSNQSVNLCIQEPGMVFAFFDFCEHLDLELFYTLEEARGLAEERMREMNGSCAD